MTSTPDQAAMIGRFADRYRQAHSDIIQRIERSTLGCDYGATSWTTRDEAETMAKLLALGPGKRALEVGSGSGWPGLYMARLTGCDVALIDLPLEGLRAAAARAVADGMAERCWPVMADGAALPFAPDRFNTVCHSDVLCCLAAKLTTLKECRRVIREAGIMVFSVISVAPDLPADDYRRATGLGPVFIGAEADYPTLLRAAGWHVAECVDITARFAESVGNLLRQEERHAAALIELVGEAAYSERVSTLRNRLEGVKLGLIRRELFTATPTPNDEYAK